MLLVVLASMRTFIKSMGFIFLAVVLISALFRWIKDKLS